MLRKTIAVVVVGVVCLAVAGALSTFRKPNTAEPEPRFAAVVVVPPPEQRKGSPGEEGRMGSAATPGPAVSNPPKGTPEPMSPSGRLAPGKIASKPAVSAAMGAAYGSGSGRGGVGIGSADPLVPGGRKSVGLGSLGVSGKGSGGGGVAIGDVLGSKDHGAVKRIAPRALHVESSSGEGYRNYGVNPFVETEKDPLSTFAVDVDTASYTIARRKLLEGTLPPKDSVRVEEFVNYFNYAYPQPVSAPLAVHMDAAPSPFTPGRHLLRVGVQGRKLSLSERKPAHLTFLVDVSGSMQSPDKLPLVKRSLRVLVDNLRDGDTVALVTYAGGVRLVLPPTGLERKAEIHAAIEDLVAGGSTAMASGIQLAYEQAMKTLDGGSVSRVLILSDGDANVGPTSHARILETIRGYVKEGITLSTFGFGMGNYKDEMMEQLADRGNGNYYYVDSLMQARRVFQEQLGGTLEVLAQDVKLQVGFDPAQVRRYRLVGYENRDIADEDFRNDRVDAGEIGAGHTVTALYELELNEGATGEGLATVRIRAKRPRGERASEAAYAFPAAHLARRFEDASTDLRFATAVMGAAEIFRQSPHAAGWSYDQIVRIARGATPDGNAERGEFILLLEKARAIVGRVAAR